MENKTLVVDGTEIETMSYEFDKMELDIDSGRNLNGVMERNILSHHPRKIIAELPPMNAEKMKNVLAVLDKPELYVTAYNPFKDAMESNIKMYHGNLKPVLYWKIESVDGTEIEVLYQKLKVELVEY